MKKILIGLVFVLFNIAAFCQYNVSGMGTLYETARETQRKSKINNFSSVQTDNNRFKIFLNKEWSGGVLFSNDSTTVKGYTYRYNIYADQIESRSIVNPSSINLVSIGSKKFMHSEYYDEDSVLNTGYFEQVIAGECQLLLRREVDYKRGTNDIRGYGGNEGTSITEELYIKKFNSPAVKIMKSKDFFKDLMSDKVNVKTFIDKKLILFMSRNRIEEIVRYYNCN